MVKVRHTSCQCPNLETISICPRLLGVTLAATLIHSYAPQPKSAVLLTLQYLRARFVDVPTSKDTVCLMSRHPRAWFVYFFLRKVFYNRRCSQTDLSSSSLPKS